MKKLFSALLVLAMILSLIAVSACSKNTTESPTPAPTESSNDPNESTEPTTDPNAEANANFANKDITVGITVDFISLEPWAAFNSGRRHIMPAIYQTLTAEIPDLTTGETVRYYVLAESAEKISEGLYEIKIREGIKDTAGNDFKASDAVFSFQTAKDMGILSQLNAIASMEVIDDYTFRMTMGKTMAVGDFDDLLTAFNMVTQKSYEASPDKMVTTPVGTTGYVLDEFVSGSHVTFKKTGNYWNAAANESKSIEDGYCSMWDDTKLNTIRYDVIPDTSALAVALEAGDIDISANVATGDVPLFQEGGKDADNFTVYAYPDNMYAISYNVSKNSPLADKNLRLAISHSVDSEGVLDAAFDGAGEIMTAWAYPTYFDYQKSWSTDPFPYDLTKAKEYFDAYLKDSGTKAADLKLRLLVVSDGAMGKAAQAIQAYVGALTGNQNTVELLSYDRATYNDLWLDPAAFDIVLLYTQSTTRTYSTYAWNSYANAAKISSGDDVWHSGDQKVQTLLNAAIAEDTHNDTTVAAFQDYVNTQAYMKNLVCGRVYVVGANWIKGLDYCLGAKNALNVTALDYDWVNSGK